MKKKKTLRNIEPGMSGYFIWFLLFCTAILWINVYMAAAGYALILVEYLIYRKHAARQKKELLGYIESMTSAVGDEEMNTVTASPFPTAIIRPESGEIIWSNDAFLKITGEKHRMFDLNLGKLLPGIDLTWLLEGKKEAPTPLGIEDQFYTVFGSSTRPNQQAGILATLYFVDITELRKTRQLYEDTRPILAIALIDNYDEIIKGPTGNESSKLIVDVEEKIIAWAAKNHCMVQKFDRDRHLLIFEKQQLNNLIEENFSILEEVKGLHADSVPLTLSIGIGTESGSYEEHFKNARLALEMALSRGGDQVVIKNKHNFHFFGGQTQEFQKQTKVKSRVMANALRQLVEDSGIVFVMSHRMSDLDSIGAGAGILCIARKLGRKGYLVVDRHKTSAPQMISKLNELQEYKGVIISPTDAILMADSRSLLVVVDTNRPESVESEELLLSCNRIVVIDHHRRSASYIENAALNFHEPYASSTSELVSELLSYIDTGGPLLKTEAEAMLAGLVLDSKNFSMRTGVRTFEAAARLRMAGADTIEIKRLFQVDFETCVDKYEVVRRASMYNGIIAISMIDYKVGRTAAAQAADELMNIQGIQASFVLFPENDRVILSARSLGQINVQVILEKFGGGGHMNMAGAQLEGVTPELALSKLYAAIDGYFKQNEIKAMKNG